ncbi:MAG: hypothetical protein IIT65_14400 [Lachnospiraceae bacterium]|nr:hypothetical protein [Lachnospiraceae bacterium]
MSVSDVMTGTKRTDIDYDGKEIELHELDTNEPSIHTMYILARWCYLMGETYLSDIEYDHIEKQFKEYYPNDIHSKQPWSFDECPVAILKKFNRESLICNPVMGYMAESIYSINNWTEFDLTFKNINEKSRLSFKIDGWNTRVSYFNGVAVDVQTRGRSGNSLDIKNTLGLFPKTIPIKGRVAITGEMSIPKHKWSVYKSITGNADQRASVRTAIARNDIEYLSFNAFNIFIENNTEEFDQYEKLEELGFTHPDYVFVDSYDKLKAAINFMSIKDNNYDYLTDGLVIENTKIQNAIRLGRWEEERMISYVEGYEEGQGAYGTFMKIKCYPIKCEGKVFSVISINNISNIIENNLRIGYPIAFNLRSSANVVIDVLGTKDLQYKWGDRLEEYKDYIRRRN